MAKSSRVKSKVKAKAAPKKQAKAPIKAKAKAKPKAKPAAKPKPKAKPAAKPKPEAKPARKRTENLPAAKGTGNAGATTSSRPKAPKAAPTAATSVDEDWGDVETSAPQISPPLPTPASDDAALE